MVVSVSIQNGWWLRSFNASNRSVISTSIPTMNGSYSIPMIARVPTILQTGTKRVCSSDNCLGRVLATPTMVFYYNDFQSLYYSSNRLTLRSMVILATPTMVIPIPRVLCALSPTMVIPTMIARVTTILPTDSYWQEFVCALPLTMVIPTIGKSPYYTILPTGAESLLLQQWLRTILPTPMVESPC